MADQPVMTVPATPSKSWLEKLGIFPATLLFVGLILFTLFLWRYSSSLVEANKAEDFVNQAHELTTDIENQLQQYRGTILATQGLFLASETVTRDEWRRYVEALNTRVTAPSLSALAYVAAVKQADKEAFINQVRSDTSDPTVPPQLLASFQIRPEGERKDYYVPVYIEPFNAENQAAFGFDLRTSPARLQALALARDTGQPTVTAKLLSVTTGLPAFALYAPIYRRGLSLATTEERRLALQGFVVKILESSRFFQPVDLAGDAQLRPIDFLVFDNQENLGPNSLLYSSSPSFTALELVPSNYLSTEIDIPVMQRTWRIIFFQPPPTTPEGLSDYVPGLILIAGTIFSFFIFVTVATMTSSILSGLDVAQRITHQLRLSEEQFRNIFASLRDLLFHTDLSGKILLVNPAAERYLHLPPDKLIGLQAETLFASPEQIRNLIARLKHGEQVADLPVELKPANGQPLKMSLNAYLLRSATGQPQEIEWVLRDVSRRSETESGLRERTAELERVNRVMLNREKEIIALKQKLKAQETKTG